MNCNSSSLVFSLAIVCAISAPVESAPVKKGAVAASVPTKAAPATKVTPIVLREGNGRRLTGLALSRDGKTVAVGSDGRVAEIYDVATRKLLKKVPGGMGVLLVALSPDSKTLATSAVDFWVNVNDVESGAKKSSNFPGVGGPSAMEWMRDGKTLALSTYHGVQMIDAQSGALLATDSGYKETSARCEALSPDQTQIAAGLSDRSVVIYSTREFNPAPLGEYVKAPRFKLALKLAPHDAEVTAIAWSPDGKTLVCGDESGAVAVWDVATKTKTATWLAGNEEVTSLAFAPSGQSVALHTRGSDLVQLWDVAKNKAKMTWKGASDSPLLFLPDGKSLLLGDKTGQVSLVPIAAFTWYQPPALPRLDVSAPFLTLPGNAESANAAAWSPDATRVAAVTERAQLRVWDARTGEQLRVPHSHTGNIAHVAWSPDGKLLATSGRSGIEITDMTTRTSLWRHKGGAAIGGFSRDGASLWVVDWEDKDIVRLSTRDWSVQQRIGNLKEFNGFYKSPWRAALSPDGSRLAVSVLDKDYGRSYRGALGVWDIAKATMIWQKPIHGWNHALAWSPDSKSLALDEGDHSDGYPDGYEFVPGQMGVKFFDAQTGATQPRTRLDLKNAVESLS